MNGLKSSFLSGVRPFYAPDDRRAAAQAERERIKVETVKKDETEKKEEVEEKEDDKSDDKKSDDEGDKDGEYDDKKGDDESDEKEEEKELTLEDYKTELAAAKSKVTRLEKRTGRTAGERDQLRKDLAKANADLEALKEAKPDATLTEEEVERRATIKATEIVTEQQFQNAVNKLIKDATKVDKEFNTKVNEMAAEVAPIPQFMIGALEDLDNGGAVLAHLANNPDTYEEIYKLSPAKMTTRLTRLSDKIAEEAKPKKKEISKVPPPIEGIKGSDKSPTQLPADPTKHMSEFVAMRNKQVAEKRKQKYG